MQILIFLMSIISGTYLFLTGVSVELISHVFYIGLKHGCLP